VWWWGGGLGRPSNFKSYNARAAIRSLFLDKWLLDLNAGGACLIWPFFHRFRVREISPLLRILLYQRKTRFDDLLLGTHLQLTYAVEWPLDLFLQPTDLQLYGVFFSYLSSLRKTHTRIHLCWTSLSNAQRARRRWTGLGEGGTVEDSEVRKALLRCSWGVVREMNWFLDNLLAYVMNRCYRCRIQKVERLLAGNHGDNSTQVVGQCPIHEQPTPGRRSPAMDQLPRHRPNPLRRPAVSFAPRLHNLANNPITIIWSAYSQVPFCRTLRLQSSIRPIFELCERFAAQVERWGVVISCLHCCLKETLAGGETE